MAHQPQARRKWKREIDLIEENSANLWDRTKILPRLPAARQGAKNVCPTMKAEKLFTRSG